MSSVTIADINLYESVKKQAHEVGLKLECSVPLMAFTVNPEFNKGLVVYKELRDMEIYLNGYRNGVERCKPQ